MASHLTGWPGFCNDRLLLPLPADWFTGGPAMLAWGSCRLHVKREFHVTLLNQGMGKKVREALAEHEVRQCFERHDWSMARGGDGALLYENKGSGHVAAASLIEHISLPSLNGFRQTLARASGIELPEAPPHVTLHATGDPGGIGLPDMQAFDRTKIASLRLPGICNRPAPMLPEEKRAAYRGADYALDALGTTIRIGEISPLLDAEFVRRQVDRAIIVTAFNPFSSRAEDAGNDLRQQWLQAVIHREGLQAVDAEGRDPSERWAPEPSLLVFGPAREYAERLLRDFEQHAIVMIERGRPARLVFHPDHACPADSVIQGPERNG